MANFIDQNKYSTVDYSYPIDLTTSPDYGGNYAVFYINIQSASRLAKSGVGIVADAITGPNANTSNTINENAVMLSQAVTGAALGTAVKLVKDYSTAPRTADSGKLSGLNALWSTGKANWQAVVGTILELGGVAAISNVAGGFNQPVKRLRTAIALNMPSALSSNYGIRYDTADVPMGMQLASDGGKVLSEAGESFKTGTLPGQGSTTASIAAALAFKGVPEVVQKMTKTAPNPTTEQVFKSVSYRTFSFTYRFAPKSEPEAKNVRAIIQQFKYHMHPEFSDVSKYLYVYPSEFDIVYYHNGVENTNINKITSCVLSDMSVNYTGAGSGFSTFDDGMPDQIDISLTFRELVLLDKSMIQEKLSDPAQY